MPLWQPCKALHHCPRPRPFERTQRAPCPWCLGEARGEARPCDSRCLAYTPPMSTLWSVVNCRTVFPKSKMSETSERERGRGAVIASACWATVPSQRKLPGGRRPLGSAAANRCRCPGRPGRPGRQPQPRPLIRFRPGPGQPRMLRLLHSQRLLQFLQHSATSNLCPGLPGPLPRGSFRHVLRRCISLEFS